MSVIEGHVQFRLEGAVDYAAYNALEISLYHELNRLLVGPCFDAISLGVWGPVIEGVHDASSRWGLK